GGSAAPVAVRSLLHALEAGVVVGELVQVRPRDPAGDVRIVVRHVRPRIVAAVLELDVHPGPELVDVERRRLPVDSDLLADPTRLLGRKPWLLAHRSSLTQLFTRCRATNAATSAAATVITSFTALPPRSFDSPPARGAMSTGTSSRRSPASTTRISASTSGAPLVYGSARSGSAFAFT